MSSLKRDIEGVLENYHNKLLMTETPYDVKQRDQATTQIINLIESVIGEIIGEDEKEMVLVESEITVAKEHGYRTKIEKSEWFDEKIHARNKLRKEQRDIKSKLIGGSNGKE